MSLKGEQPSKRTFEELVMIMKIAALILCCMGWHMHVWPHVTGLGGKTVLCPLEFDPI